MKGYRRCPGSPQSQQIAYQCHQEEKKINRDRQKLMHSQYQSEDFHGALRKRLFKYIENFTSKNRNFSDKKNKKKKHIFHISAQNIDYGYSFEPPQRGGANEYPQSMF